MIYKYSLSHETAKGFWGFVPTKNVPVITGMITLVGLCNSQNYEWHEHESNVPCLYEMQFQIKPHTRLYSSQHFK